MSQVKKRELPKFSGINSLFGDNQNPEENNENNQSSTLLISEINLPPSQPRRYFDLEKIQSLADSIKQDGLLEPLVVRKTGDAYELIAGERRFKACQIIGLDEVPVRIIDCDEKTALRIRLVENLQREDLNAYEETIGIIELIAAELEVDFDTVVLLMYQMNNDTKGLSNHNVMVRDESKVIQSAFSQLGKITWQSFVANRLPLLKLPSDIQEVLASGKLEYTKASAIARIKDEESRQACLTQAIEEKLSLSKIKELVGSYLQESPKRKEKILPNKKEITSRFNQASKALKDSDIWDKPQSLKQLVKALNQIEKLLAETEHGIPDEENARREKE